MKGADKEIFYKNVRKAMIDGQISQKELIAIVNELRRANGKKKVTYQCINNQIRGIDKPSEELLSAIEQRCGVSRDQLMRER